MTEEQNPWDGVEMPEGFDPEKNRFLNPDAWGSIGFLIQPNPVDKGAQRTQDEWIEYFRGNDEQYFPSMADLYVEFKKMADNLQEHPDDVNLMRYSMLEVISGKTIVTSTRIVYDGSGLDAQVIHNYGSERPISRELVVPDYSLGPRVSDLTDTSWVIDRKFTTAYLQALFNTDEDFPRIFDVIGKAFNVDGNGTRLWTPNQESRKGEYSKSAASFLYVPNDKDVSLSNLTTDEKGCSISIWSGE